MCLIRTDRSATSRSVQDVSVIQDVMPTSRAAEVMQGMQYVPTTILRPSLLSSVRVRGVADMLRVICIGGTSEVIDTIEVVVICELSDDGV